MRDSKFPKLPHHSVENRKNLSQSFFAKILKNFRENNAIMEFFSKIELEMTQFCNFRANLRKSDFNKS